MPKVLVLFAHPRLERSRSNRALLQRFPEDARITLHDLYERYPDFNVDIAHEQGLVEAHDTIVLHHPIYWYSVPPLLKQWIDLVLAFGWAYGPNGIAVKGKTWLHAVTTAGMREAYSKEGYHGSTLLEFLLPLKRTATLCGMRWLPPFAVHGTNRLGDAELERQSEAYSQLLTGLAQGSIDLAQAERLTYLNEAVPNLHLP